MTKTYKLTSKTIPTMQNNNLGDKTDCVECIATAAKNKLVDLTGSCWQPFNLYLSQTNSRHVHVQRCKHYYTVAANTDDDKQLTEFERAGAEKHLYSERCKQEKDTTDKKAENMVYE